MTKPKKDSKSGKRAQKHKPHTDPDTAQWNTSGGDNAPPLESLAEILKVMLEEVKLLNERNLWFQLRQERREMKRVLRENKIDKEWKEETIRLEEDRKQWKNKDAQEAQEAKERETRGNKGRIRAQKVMDQYFKRVERSTPTETK